MSYNMSYNMYFWTSSLSICNNLKIWLYDNQMRESNHLHVTHRCIFKYSLIRNLFVTSFYYNVIDGIIAPSFKICIWSGWWDKLLVFLETLYKEINISQCSSFEDLLQRSYLLPQFAWKHPYVLTAFLLLPMKQPPAEHLIESHRVPPPWVTRSFWDPGSVYFTWAPESSPPCSEAPLPTHGRWLDRVMDRASRISCCGNLWADV